MHLVYEDMSPAFGKWHVEGFPFYASIHHLRGPDIGYPHDHPWPFRRYILKGDYDEEQYDKETGAITMNTLREGDSGLVLDTDVHRIVRVSESGCWTIIVPIGVYGREWRFWRFEPGRIVSRAHNEDWPA